jgi:hypothetical protein
MELLVNYGIQASQITEQILLATPIDYYWNDTETRQAAFQRGYYEEELPLIVQMLKDIKASTPTVTNLTTSGSGRTGGAKFLGNYWYANGSYPHYHYRRTGSITGSQTTFTTSGVGREYDLTFNATGTKVIVNDYKHRWNWNGTVYATGDSSAGEAPANNNSVGQIFAHSSVGIGYWAILVSTTNPNIFYYTFIPFAGQTGGWTFWKTENTLSDVTVLRSQFTYDGMAPYEFITGSSGSYAGTDFAIIRYNNFYENRSISSSISAVEIPNLE